MPQLVGHGAPLLCFRLAADWLERQRAKLSPARYFMITFTLPAALRPLANRQQAVICDFLFATAIDTMCTFGRRHLDLDADLAATAVLHTHDRQLDYHPTCTWSSRLPAWTGSGAGAPSPVAI